MDDGFDVPKPENNPEIDYPALHEKEQRLIQDVLTNGRSLLSTWAFNTDQGTGQGYTNPIDMNLFGPGKQYPSFKETPAYWGKDLREVLAEKGTNELENQLAEQDIPEIVLIDQATKDIMGTKTTTRQVKKKSLFGGTKFVYEQYEKLAVVGQEPITVGEAFNPQFAPPFVDPNRPDTQPIPLTISDPNEECYVIHYHTPPIKTGMRISDNFVMKDGSGRPGNFMDMKFLIPKSVAQQVSEVMAKDPGFIRKLVMNAYRIRYPKIWQETQSFGRPSYSQWEQQVIPKMYLVDRIKNPNAARNLQPGDFVDKNEVIAFKGQSVPINGKPVMFAKVITPTA